MLNYLGVHWGRVAWEFMQGQLVMPALLSRVQCSYVYISSCTGETDYYILLAPLHTPWECYPGFCVGVQHPCPNLLLITSTEFVLVCENTVLTFLRLMLHKLKFVLCAPSPKLSVN